MTVCHVLKIATAVVHVAVLLFCLADAEFKDINLYLITLKRLLTLVVR